MTEYNGQTITYDKIGNPLKYRDGMTMTWKRGRQLTDLQTEGNSIQYKYDSDSIRTSKIVNGVVYTYEYLNGLLMHETRGEQAYDYYYDANGQLYAVSYKLSETDTKKVYYFTHNWRGDVVGIYNGNGDLKATYEYDAWGNVVSIEDANGNAITSATHIANLNPFRYRGYYMDTETGLYYLMSRYYDPVTHRFVNADGYFQSGGDILDINMNAYCGNNPANYVDPTGKCYIHTSWYVPTCKICANIPITPKPIYTSTVNTTIGFENSNNSPYFACYDKFGDITRIDDGMSFLGYGLYTKAGSYVVTEPKGSIMNISTFYDVDGWKESSISLETSVFSFTFGLDNIGLTVGIPWDNNFYGIESSFSFNDGFINRIGFTQIISNGQDYYIESGFGVEYNRLINVSLAAAAIAGPPIIVAVAGLISTYG